MDHNSGTCDNQNTSQQIDATLDNRMGGSDRIYQYLQNYSAPGPENWGWGASISSVVKPNKFKAWKNLDIVPQKTNFVDFIDTGTKTHCFQKERNVEKLENLTKESTSCLQTGATHNLLLQPK